MDKGKADSKLIRFDEAKNVTHSVMLTLLCSKNQLRLKVKREILTFDFRRFTLNLTLVATC
jgi:hypothetical protein